MFGRQDSSQDSSITSSADQPILNMGSGSVSSQPVASPAADTPSSGTSPVSASAQPSPSLDNSSSSLAAESSLPAPSVPDVPAVAEPAPEPSTISPTTSLATDEPQDVPSLPTSSTPADSDDLMNIKQQALQQIKPLVGQLDQTPEEKFQTTMMMIQGSDDQSLIKDAYETANQITDEKAKAQALLDIVNEINYFTHHAGSEQ